MGAAMATKMPDPLNALRTWGEAAAELRVSLATMKRWAQKYDDLPYMRGPGENGRIHIDRHELREWYRRRMARPVSRGKPPRR